MQYPHYIYRSKVKVGVMLFTCGLLLLLWILALGNVIQIEGYGHSVFFVFHIFFVVPCLVYFAYLLVQREPIVSIYEDRVVLRGGANPWRTTSLRWNEMVNISTEWEGFNTESWADLIFEVSEEAFIAHRGDKVFRKRKQPKLYYEFSMAQLSPFRGVELLERYLTTRSS